MKNVNWEDEKSQNVVTALRKFINDLGHKEYVPKQKQVKTQPPNSKKATAQPEMVVPAKPS
jgi:hypothetical protein